MSHATLQILQARLRSDAAFRRAVLSDPGTALADYDLTADERAQLVLPNFSWVLPDVLAGTARPYSSEAFALLAQRGIRAVLTLTETPLPAAELQQVELESYHLPIADFGAPTLKQAQTAVTTIQQWRDEGKPVVVHCAAGIGRTGTILACYLVSQGASASDALAQIRQLRPGSVETAAQAALVAAFANQHQG